MFARSFVRSFVRAGREEVVDPGGVAGREGEDSASLCVFAALAWVAALGVGSAAFSITEAARRVVAAPFEFAAIDVIGSRV